MSVTDYDFKLLRDEIVTRAFRIVGVIGVDDTLTAGQLKQGTDILHSVCQSWQLRGTFLWTWTTFTTSLVVGQQSYDLPTDPPILFIEGGKVNAQGVQYTVEPMAYVDFLKIENLTTPGLPTVISTDSQGKFHLYPVPDSELYTSVTCVGVQRLKDWSNSSSDGGFPAHWGNALVHGVAAELSAEYGVPVRERQQLQFEAESAYNLAKRGERGRSNHSFVRSAYQ